MTKRPLDALCDFLGIEDMSVCSIEVRVTNANAPFMITTKHVKIEGGQVETESKQWTAVPCESESDETDT